MTGKAGRAGVMEGKVEMAEAETRRQLGKMAKAGRE